MNTPKQLEYFIGFTLVAILLTGCPLLDDGNDTEIGVGNDVDGTEMMFLGDTSSDWDATYHHDSEPLSVVDTMDVDTGPLDLGEEIILTTTGNLGSLACYGDRVTWTVLGKMGDEIHMWTAGANITTGPSGVLGNNDLVMSDQVIAWTNYDNDAIPFTASDVYYATLSSLDGVPHAQSELDEIGPRVDGNSVVYQQYTDLAPELRAGPLGGAGESLGEFWEGSYDIFGDLVAAAFEGEHITVRSLAGAADVLIPTTSAARGVRISGNIVVWYELMDFGNGSGIYAQNLQNQKRQTAVYRLDGEPIGLDVDAGYAAYAGSAMVAGEPLTAVFLWNIQNNTVRVVASGYERIYDVCIGGGRIAWLTGNAPYADATQNIWEIRTALLPR